MYETPDLSLSFHPQPKPHKKVKMPEAMKTVGKKTQTWTEVREILKQRYYKVKITSCEVKLNKNCWGKAALGFAHLEKRVKIPLEDIHMTVLSCNICHTEFEKWPAEKMKELLEGIINNRKVQP